MQHFYIKNLVIKQQQQQHKWKRKEVNQILKTKKRRRGKNRNKKKKQTNKQNHAIVFNCHCPFCCGREKKNSIRKKYFKKP